eukprot:2858220-Amphidinium_carterae.1
MSNSLKPFRPRNSICSPKEKCWRQGGAKEGQAQQRSALRPTRNQRKFKLPDATDLGKREASPPEADTQARAPGGLQRNHQLDARAIQGVSMVMGLLDFEDSLCRVQRSKETQNKSLSPTLEKLEFQVAKDDQSTQKVKLNSWLWHVSGPSLRLATRVRCTTSLQAPHAGGRGIWVNLQAAPKDTKRLSATWRQLI